MADDELQITSIDTQAAREAARLVQETTDFIAGAYNALLWNLDQRKGCAGNDEIGKQFNEKYDPNVKQYCDSVREWIDKSLQPTAKDVAGIPDTFEAVDDGNRIQSSDN